MSKVAVVALLRGQMALVWLVEMVGRAQQRAAAVVAVLITMEPVPRLVMRPLLLVVQGGQITVAVGLVQPLPQRLAMAQMVLAEVAVLHQPLIRLDLMAPLVCLALYGRMALA